jgi:hypothetical protein
MRALPALLALVVFTVSSGGCVSGDRGAVLLHLDQPSADLFLLPTYSSSTASVQPTDGQFLFLATSNQGILRLLLLRPLLTGDTITLPIDEERVRFQVANSEWGNQGGTVFVISADPEDRGGAIIGLRAVPMVPRSLANGSFVFNGDGTFRCDESADEHCARPK